MSARRLSNFLHLCIGVALLDIDPRGFVPRTWTVAFHIDTALMTGPAEEFFLRIKTGETILKQKVKEALEAKVMAELDKVMAAARRGEHNPDRIIDLRTKFWTGWKAEDPCRRLAMNGTPDNFWGYIAEKSLDFCRCKKTLDLPPEVLRDLKAVYKRSFILCPLECDAEVESFRVTIQFGGLSLNVLPSLTNLIICSDRRAGASASIAPGPARNESSP